MRERDPDEERRKRAVSLKEKLELIDQQWSTRIVAEFNDYHRCITPVLVASSATSSSL